MNLAEIFAVQVAARPSAPAIIESFQKRSRITSFAELELASQRAATLLKTAGLEPGDAILIFQPMSAELYIALLAAFRLGLVAMFLDPSAGREHLERCCEINPPRALIACPRAHLLRLVSPALRRIPIQFVIGWPLPGATRFDYGPRVAPAREIVSGPCDRPALLTFTSGSTGQPKAAVRTHGFLLAQHRVLERALELVPGEIDLATLPIFVLANLASGVTSLIPDADMRFPARIDAEPVVAQILMHRPHRAGGSPALFERLACHCVKRKIALTSLRKIFAGGGSVFPHVLDRWQSMAPAAEVVMVYGSTEAEPIARISQRELTPADLISMKDGRGLIAGSPVEEIELRILKDQWGKPVGPLTSSEFAAASSAAGQIGEIVVSGEHVLAGYLNGIGDEETKFRVDGKLWHRTGDAGYLDARGCLWLTGRCGARIEDAHGTLYPLMVESAVHQADGVRRVALLSHKGKRLLFVEAEPGSPLTCLRAQLAWAHIDEFKVVQRLPMDKRHNAKIDYPTLKQFLD